LTWAKAIEDCLRIRIPERAQAIRIVFLELARICEHLTVLSDICIQLKMNEFSILIDAREKIFELFEKVCGHRQGVGETQIGGVRFDLPPGWVVEYQAVYEIIQKNFLIVHKSLTSQVHFRKHLE
jgi:NADH-quinone oxidoreductase subunit C/D